MARIPFSVVRERMMTDPEFRTEYDALEEEFALVEAMIEARAQANMTQADVAQAMGVSQPRVARIESGKNVSLETLRRYAKATGGKLKIAIEPGKAEETKREAR
jgi:transcriptional regulator with XRE-family HTH domain